MLSEIQIQRPGGRFLGRLIDLRDQPQSGLADGMERIPQLIVDCWLAEGCPDRTDQDKCFMGNGRLFRRAGGGHLCWAGFRLALAGDQPLDGSRSACIHLATKDVQIAQSFRRQPNTGGRVHRSVLGGRTMGLPIQPELQVVEPITNGATNPHEGWSVAAPDAPGRQCGRGEVEECGGLLGIEQGTGGGEKWDHVCLRLLEAG